MGKKQDKDIGLLFLHALPLDGSMWSGFADMLPGSSYAPTLYNHGYSIRDWADAALRLTSHDHLIVVGCSVGGSVALEIAAIAPERVEALVLIGTKADHRPDSTSRDLVIETLESRGIEEAWEAHWAPLFSDKTDACVVEQAKQIATRLSPAEIGRGVSVFHSRPSRGTFAESWQKPAIIVTGEGDVAPGVQASVALANSMPKGCCRIIQETGHYVPLEQPDVLRAILEEVIASARR